MNRSFNSLSFENTKTCQKSHKHAQASIQKQTVEGNRLQDQAYYSSPNKETQAKRTVEKAWFKSTPGEKNNFSAFIPNPQQRAVYSQEATTNYSVAHRRQKSHCMLLRVILGLEFHSTAKHTPATKQYTHNRVVVRSLLSFWCDQTGNELVT